MTNTMNIYLHWIPLTTSKIMQQNLQVGARCNRTFSTLLSIANKSARCCTVPKYRAAVDYTPRLRAPRNLPRCMANSDTCEAVANHSPGSATANSYLGMTST